MTLDPPRPAPSTPALWAIGAAVLVLMPHFSITPFATDYDATRLLEIATWVALVGAGVASRSIRDAWCQTWARVPRHVAWSLGAALLLGVAASALAARPVYALVEVASFAMMGIAAVALASAGAERARAGLAFTAVLVLGGYAIATVPLHLVDLWTGAAEVWPQQHLGFDHVRHLNQLQAWFLPVVWAVAAAASARRATYRQGALQLAALRGVASLTVVFVLAASGRGILLAFGLAVVAAVAVLGRRSTPVLREAAVSAVAGLIFWGILFAAFGESGTGLSRLGSGSVGRLEMWAASLRMAASNPWLGVGPIHFAYYLGPFASVPHNLLLQLAAEWGVPVALIGVLVAVQGLRSWVGQARQADKASRLEPDAWPCGLTMMVVAVLVNAMVDGSVTTPTSQIAAATGLGALLAEGLPATRRCSRPVWASARLAAVALPSVALLLAVAASEAPRLARRHYDLRMAHTEGGDMPRFWSCGQIAGHIPEDNARFWPEEEAPAFGPLTSR